MRRYPISGILNITPTLVGSKVRLRPKQIKDAANDYSWRTNTELCQLDAALPMPISFDIYLKSYIEELNYPRRGCCLAIETLDGRHIGNCSYFSLDEIKQETEMGIMIGDKAYWDYGYGTDTISTLLNHIFSQAGMQRVYLRTLDWNKRAHTCFTKCGFVPCGQLIQGDYHFIIMEIRRQANPTNETVRQPSHGWNR